MVAAGCFQAEGLSDQGHVCMQAEGGIVIMRLEEGSFCDVLQHQPVHQGRWAPGPFGEQGTRARPEKKRARTMGLDGEPEIQGLMCVLRVAVALRFEEVAMRHGTRRQHVN